MHKRSGRIRRVVAGGAAFACIGTGAVVVAAAPAAAVEVSNEVQLRAAWATASSIELDHDITLTDCTGGGAAERTSIAPVVLDGDGHTIRQTCVDNVLLQETPGAGPITLEHLTLTGGASTSSGGGIFAQGDLHLVDVTLHHNHADASGGGLATLGTLLIERSTIRDNNASLGGGGAAAGLAATVIDSTIADNLGGGLATLPVPAASATFVNSTITGNREAANGAGIFSGGTVTLVYTTVVDNVAQVAFDNVQASDGGVRSFASLVFGGAGPRSNCLFSVDNVSFGYNYSDDDTCGFTQPTDRQDLTDPELGPLRDNGGPTRTLLPDDGSPLVDAIPDGHCRDDGASSVDTDQRGVERPQDDRCDIGAVEVEEDAPDGPVTPAAAAPIPGEPTFTG
jgi:hypothetical protein